MIDYIESSIDVIIQAGREDGKRGITEFYLPGTELGMEADT
jgi:type IV secretion system protein VirB11